MPDRQFPIEVQSNHQLNYLLLTEVIRMIETESGLVRLLELGCDAELIDSLRRRSSRDLLDLSAKLRCLRISFSPAELRQNLDGIDRQRREDALCEYFVKNGASQPLLTKLFSRSASEVRKLREVLVGGGNVGRTRLPRDLQVRDEIHRAWYQISKYGPHANSLRDGLYQLHQQFPEYSIDSLYSTVREFEVEGTVPYMAAHQAIELKPAA